jgi:hypothetical protein
MKRIGTLFIPIFYFLIISFSQAQQTPDFNCGFDYLRSPAQARRIQSFEEQLQQYFSKKKDSNIAENALPAPPYVVPVVVHIIHDGGPENISDARVLAAIDHMNEGFGAQGYFAQQGAMVNTQIQFCLAKRDPDGNATTGITRTQSPLTNMTMETQDIQAKDLNRWNPKDYVNIWVVKEITSISLGDGVAGYAYFPSSHGKPEDGMICEAQFFGTNPSEDAVLIHEMGHYFGLYHTFEGGCKNDDCTVDGDRVCDTPPDQVQHSDCAYNSCGTDVALGSPFTSDVNDFTADFMDYSPFQCYHIFTAGQATRMQGVVATTRASLLESKGCLDPCTLPIVTSFTTSVTDIKVGQTVLFTNQSTGATGFQWYVNGVFVANSVNLNYQFTVVGNYKIELIASNSDPNCFGSYAAYFVANCDVEAAFTVSAATISQGGTVVCSNTSNGAVGYEWSINGVNVGATTGLSYTFNNAGVYTITLQAVSNYCSSDFSLAINVKSEPCPDTVTASKYGFANAPSTSLHYSPGYRPDDGFYTNTYLGFKSLVTRFDAAGNSIWQKQVVVTSNGTEDLCALDDGSAIFSNDGNNLLKLNEDGTLGWAKSLTLPSGTVEFTTINTGDGAIAYAINQNTIVNGGSKLYMFKYLSDGTQAWSRVYSFPTNSFITSDYTHRAENGFWLCGYSALENFPYTPSGGLVLRFDKDGNLLFCKQYRLNNNVNVSFYTVAFNKNDEFVVGGVENQLNNNGNGNQLLLKGNATGDVLWAKKYTQAINANFARGQRIIARPNGGYLNSLLFNISSRKWTSWSETGQLEFVEETTSPGYIEDIVIHKGRLTGFLSKAYNAADFFLFNMTDEGKPVGCTDLVISTIPTTDAGFVVQDYPVSLITPNVPVAPLTVTLSSYTQNLLNSPFCTVKLPCPEICDNQSDDDDDGYVDCFDTDCACYDVDTACTVTPPFKPFSAKIAWESAPKVVEELSTPLVVNLNPQVDSMPEIIVEASNPNQILYPDELLIYKGDGSNKLNPVHFIPGNGNVLDYTPPLVIDVNADGIPELLVATHDSKISVYTNYQENQSPPFTLMCESAPATSTGLVSMLNAADFDQDGIPEIFVGNKIYVFDFSNPAAPTLTRKLVGTAHAGALPSVGGSGFLDISAAADLLTRADCNGDPDCDGLELAAGAYIYSVDLDPTDGDGLQIKVQRNLNVLAFGDTYSDGFTQIADVNLDGTPDIVVDGRKNLPSNQVEGFYVWDKNGLVSYFKTFISGYQESSGKLTIANVYDDRKAGFTQDFPEIIMKMADSLWIGAFNLQAQSLNPAKPYWWLAPMDDLSGDCFVSGFDFNQDGFSELVAKGDSFLRVYYGGAAPFPPGVNPVTRVWYQLAHKNGTTYDGAVVADVDNDHAAEILYTVRSSGNYLGELRVIESANQPWPAARPLWNQYNYFQASINDDLTVPKVQQKHWLEMGGIGSGKRPFNTHLVQVPSLNPFATNKLKVPDANIVLDSTHCRTDSLDLFFSICNVGRADLPSGASLAFYNGNPTNTAAALLFPPVLLPAKIEIDACENFKLSIPATYNSTVFVVVNDDGTVARPFNLMTNFPSTDQEECHYENNITSFSVPHQTLPLSLGPDITLCKNSVLELHANPGFQRYRWQNGYTDSTFTAYQPGKYWVDAFDVCGFRQTDTVNIVLNALDTLDLPDQMSVCFGETVNLAASGFSNYNWWPTDSVNCADCAAVNLSAKKSVTLYLTAAKGNCFVTDSVQIIVHPNPTVQLSVSNGSCGTAASITPIVSGAAPFVFQWSNTTTDSIASISMPGTYTVEIIDQNACRTKDSAAVLITNNLNVSSFKTGPACPNSATGSVDLSVGGGVGPYQFLWSNSAVTEDLSDVGAGVYSVVVNDANGCTTMDTITLAEPPALSLSLQKTDPACAGEASGALNLTASGGTGALQFLWSNNAVTEDLNNSQTGVYSVVVSDANGCTATISGTITAPPALSVSLQKTNPACAGEATGALNLTATGGTGALQFLWSNSAVTEDISNSQTGIYSVVVRDANGCTATISDTLAAPPALSVSLQKTNPACAGEPTGKLDLAASGGAGVLQFLWSNNAVTEDLTNTGSGIYNVVVTDANGCTVSISDTLTAPPALGLSLQKTNPACAGQATGTLDLTATGGTGALQFLWSNNAVTEDLNNSSTGIYSVIVSDANGCTATISDTLIAPPAFSLSLQKTNPDCAGEATGALNLTVSGGTGTLQFLWSNNAVTEDLNNSNSGVYSVVVSDANGCTAGISDTITAPPALVLDLQKTNPSCAGEATGKLDLTASGGTGALQFQWSNNAVTEDLNNSSSGSYSVIVTDANGCTATASETLAAPPPLSLNLQKNDLHCPGDTVLIDASASGGTPPFSFTWSSGASSEDIKVSQSGTYVLGLLDFQGCKWSDSTTVAMLGSAPVLQLTSDTLTCQRTSVVISVSSNLPNSAFSWSGAGGFSSSLPSPAVTTNGTFSVTVTEPAGGCTSVASVFVPIDTSAPSIVLASNMLEIPCDQSSISISAAGSSSGPNFAVEWAAASGGVILSGATTLSPVVSSAGMYHLLISDVSNGCTATDGVEVFQLDKPTAVVATDSVRCFGETNGAIRIVSSSGGAQPLMYAIDNQNFITDTVFENLGAGNYQVYVRDAKGCLFLTQTEIAQPAPVTVALTGDSLIVAGENAHVQAFVSPPDFVPAQIEWSAQDVDFVKDQLEQSAVLLQNTLFQINIANEQGCSASDSWFVRVNRRGKTFIPNVIAPGAQGGINQVFLIFSDGGIREIASLDIYDRWGNQVFSNRHFQPNDETQGWNGVFREKTVAPGVFAWVLKLVYKDGTEEVLSGDLTVIR